jgi:hypothetical protein
MAMTMRKGSAALTVRALVMVTLVAGGVWMVVRNAPAHAGEHFVSGREARGVSGSLSADALVGETDASSSCFYPPGRKVVIVPIVLTARTEGALTFAVTATITNRPDGYDGDEYDGGDGKVVASVNSDVPYDGRSMKNKPMIWYLNIPLSEAKWLAGTNDCAMRWSMTPGAWFPNHD